MIKINKKKHAKSTGIHDFSTTPKTFPQQHATHFLLSLQVKMSFCQGHFVRHLVPFGTEISRPFCQGILLSRHPFVKASFCQGILLSRAPFCQGSSGNSELQPKAALVNCRCRRTRYFWHTLPQSLGALTPKLTEWASLDKCPTKSSDLKLE